VCSFQNDFGSVFGSVLEKNAVIGSVFSLLPFDFSANKQKKTKLTGSCLSWQYAA